MDIKEIIVIGGVLLLLAIVGHGLWVVRRARRNTLRMDISPKSSGESASNEDPGEPSLRGELPNGGARIVSVVEDPAPRQDSLQLDMDEPSQSGSKQQNRNGRRNAKADAILSNRRNSTTSPAKRSPSITPKQQEQAAGNAPTDTKLTELIVISVLARADQSFAGADLVAALRQQGLRFGEMNIFHSVDEATASHIYSVANACEPGTFDLADLSGLHSPGLTFFLQLPSAVDGMEALESMLAAAQDVARELDGELKDENMSAMTGQTAEHLRQRVSDFARRYLTQRAGEVD